MDEDGNRLLETIRMEQKYVMECLWRYDFYKTPEAFIRAKLWRVCGFGV